MNIGELEVIKVPITDVMPNDWNPNVQTDEMYQKTMRSILTKGFLVPILTRSGIEGEAKYQIIDGEHRHRVMFELSKGSKAWTPAQKVLIEAQTELTQLLKKKLIPIIDLGEDVSDDEARELTLMINQIHGEVDNIKLSELIKDLSERHSVEELAENLPYSQQEIQNLIDLLDSDWKQFESDDKDDATDEENDKWVDMKFRVPVDAVPIIESEIDRIGGILNIKADLQENVKRGLILEKICVLSAQTPAESLED